MSSQEIAEAVMALPEKERLELARDRASDSLGACLRGREMPAETRRAQALRRR